MFNSELHGGDDRDDGTLPLPILNSFVRGLQRGFVWSKK